MYVTLNDDDVYYIGNSFIDCCKGDLKGKVYKITATTSNGKELVCMVEAKSVDDAQNKLLHASRNDPIKLVSFNIVLHKEA